MKILLFLAIAAAPAIAQRNPLLPDPRVTPGVANPAVTQANIQQTICRPNWTKTIRPPARYTDALKLRQMKALHLPGKPADYEEDHHIPLEIGGHPTDPRNIRPQPWPEAHKKDVVETALKREVCSGEISLVKAQQEIATDWTAVYLRLKGTRP